TGCLLEPFGPLLDHWSHQEGPAEPDGRRTCSGRAGWARNIQDDDDDEGTKEATKDELAAGVTCMHRHFLPTYDSIQYTERWKLAETRGSIFPVILGNGQDAVVTVPCNV
ncbi:hypothetical protein THAOC_18982, partial [Thalassiosira oceanica]